MRFRIYGAGTNGRGLGFAGVGDGQETCTRDRRSDSHDAYDPPTETPGRFSQADVLTMLPAAFGGFVPQALGARRVLLATLAFHLGFWGAAPHARRDPGLRRLMTVVMAA